MDQSYIIVYQGLTNTIHKEIEQNHSALKRELPGKNVSKVLSMDSINKIYFELDKGRVKKWKVEL